MKIPKKHYNMNSTGKTLKQLQKPLMKSSINPVYKVTEIQKMNWKQLKQKYPMMNPIADSDFDGLINSRDCKPLDPSKDGAFSEFIGKTVKF